MTIDELDWLGTERPARALTATSTARARSALLDHIEGVHAQPAVPVTPLRRRRGTRGRLVGLEAVAAAAAIALFAAGTLGDGSHGRGTENAAALSVKVSQSAPPAGDATLVLRTHTFADGSTMTGADLYTDDGHYYYSPTRAGLPAQITAGSPQGGGSIERELQAAVAAIDGPLAEARTRMADAPLDPAAATATSDAKAADQAKAEALRARKAGGSSSDVHPDPEMVTNNHIWGSCLDALVAGAGRPDVRAGVLRLLSTIDAVSVEHTTTNGRPTLELRAHVFPKGYEERLVIDAETGTPIQLIGTDPGKKPGVVVDYQVTRVTTADVAKD